jgi:hypothetical protein
MIAGTVTQEKLLQLVYRADDREGERRAWRALVGALGAGKDGP